MRLIPSLLALSLLSAPSFAAERWFDIELIIFERNSQDSREIWPYDQPSIDTSKGLNLAMPELVPSMTPCPSLNQQQILQVISNQQLISSSDSPLIECVIAPSNSLLSIVPQRDAVADDQSRYNSLFTQPSLTLPEKFSYQQRNYQVIPAPAMPAQMPVRISAGSMPAKSVSAQLLPKTSLRLNWLVKKLKREQNINPKLHMAWRQAVKPRHLAKPIHLFGGQNFAKRFNQDGSAITHSTTEFSTSAQQALSRQPTWPLWEIDGLFNVYLNHYLFIELQLDRKITSNITLMMPDLAAQTLGSPVNPTDAEQTVTNEQAGMSLIKPAQVNEQQQTNQPTLIPTQVPRLVNHPLRQHRRVISKEIHYFDHPDLGIIVQIRRVDEDS